jgi:hypothetical protein
MHLLLSVRMPTGSSIPLNAVLAIHTVTTRSFDFHLKAIAVEDTV